MAKDENVERMPDREPKQQQDLLANARGKVNQEARSAVEKTLMANYKKVRELDVALAQKTAETKSAIEQLTAESAALVEQYNAGLL